MNKVLLQYESYNDLLSKHTALTFLRANIIILLQI